MLSDFASSSKYQKVAMAAVDQERVRATKDLPHSRPLEEKEQQTSC